MALYKRGHYWWYDFQHKGKRYQANTNQTDRLLAEASQEQAKSEVGQNLRMRRETADPGVYFLLSQATSFVKVGCSGNVSERIGQYETTNPEKLTLIAKLPIVEYHKAEKVIHEFLRPFHVRGEWYEITPRHVEAAILFWATGHPMFEHRKTVRVRKVQPLDLEAGS